MRITRLAVGCLLFVGCADPEALEGGPEGDAGFPGTGGAVDGGAGAPPGSGGVPGTGGLGTGGLGTGGLGTGGLGTGGLGTGGLGTGGMAGAGGMGTGGTAGAGGMGTGGMAGSGGMGTGGMGTGGSGHDDPAAGCGSTTLLPVPNDPAVRGPWDVGVRTVSIGRLTVEIVYPAEPGSTDGLPEATYDVRDWLPVNERNKVPDASSPAVGPIGGRFFRDVPIDSEHGPYPVVIMIHGTASFRIASGSINAHWASRGFVVVMADYPGLGLHDKLAEVPGCGNTVSGAQDIPADVNAQLAALASPANDLSFLAGRLDMTRLGISGHSQGACAAALLTSLPNVQVVIPLTGSTTVAASSNLKSILFIAGIDDTVIRYTDPFGIGNLVCPLGTSNVAAYTNSPGPPNVKKRIVGITGGGHLVPSDLCQTNSDGNNAVQEAKARNVCGIDNAVVIGLPALFDCGTISMADGVAAVNYASTAALEETLHCKNRDAEFTQLQTRIPLAGDFQHAP